MTSLADIELLDLTTRGSREAFGELVARHQSLVCAVAYSIVGDISRSEDVAQEAFIAAWKQLGQLQDAARFKSWICGITRNLAFLALRKERQNRPLDERLSVAGAQPGPAENAVTREEEPLVRSALTALPENYREPLVLFYRDGESVARVAAALELSDDAVKKRLARGRELLRAEIAATVERTLRRSGPGAVFTLAVLGALPGFGAATASAASAASTGAVAKGAVPLAAAAVQAGLIGAVLGTLGGIAGAALGAWASWQNARYQRERDLYRRSMIIFAIGLAVFVAPFVAMSLGWLPLAQGQPAWLGLVAYGLWMTVFFAANGWWIWHNIRAWRRIVAEEVAAGSPMLPQTELQKSLTRWEGRQWASRQTFLGLPLIHINCTGPHPRVDETGSPGWTPRTARGWIAIGDRAYGVVLAMGGTAVGGIALGGFGCGGFVGGGLAIGGLALGLVGMGGLGMGLLALGGGSLGLYSVGVLAMGWLAAGGLALGWQAFGGGALGWKAAKGGLAIAHDYALGGTAQGAHVNDEAAHAFIDHSWFFRNVEPLLARVNSVQQNGWFIAAVIAATILFLAGYWSIAYRRAKPTR